MISIKDLERETMTPEKKKVAKNDLFAFYIGRPLSYLLTIPLLYTKISPNTITYISMVWVILGTILSCLQLGPVPLIIGWLFFFLWNLFDGIDGNIARYKKKFSKNGSVVDATSGYLAMYFTFLAYGVAAYNYPGYVNNFINIPTFLYIIFGSISGFSLIFPRLVMHKKKSSIKDNDVSDIQDKSNYGFIKKVALNLTSIAGFVQLFMLVICILTFWNIYLFDIFTIFYLVINFLLMTISIIKLFID